MTENAEAKAKRYLGEGRLTIMRADGVLIEAVCRGGGAVYAVTWVSGRGWSCDCPARGRCAHLRALQLVTVRPTTEES